MKTTFTIFLRSDKSNSDKTNTISLRVTKNRKSKLFSLGVFVLPKDWSEKRRLVKTSDVQFERKNKIINKYSTRAENIISDYFLNDKVLSFEEFNFQLFKESSNSNCFYTFMSEEIEKDKDKFSKSAYDGYKSNLNVFKNFKKELYFNEIDVTFIRSFENFLIREAYAPTTIEKMLKTFKSFINRAIESGTTKNENPFDKIKIKRTTGNRAYLNLQDLKTFG